MNQIGRLQRGVVIARTQRSDTLSVQAAHNMGQKRALFAFVHNPGRDFPL